ncbi:serine/threonine-protein kinase [Amycolatopsis magusensis]|uniref:serine/threonine-protein kinase n=1 Tax=Amycolatopsis magusensis TaxID=882444 RepID=UPI003796FD2F
MVIRGEDLKKPTYTILRTLNEGTTAICHLAYHDIFQRDVVQKTVSLLGLDDALAYREPKMLDEIKHEHIVEVKEAQWDPEYREVSGVTFTMPYYSGGSLLKVLQEDASFSLGHAIDLGCQVLDALHYLHAEQKLVHRDVKPGNVFLSEDLRKAYVGDLGSAASIEEKGYSEARGGTPLYMPPEFAQGTYGIAGDIYGAGMILLELVNGRLPYEYIDHNDVVRRNKEGKRSLPERLLVPDVHAPDRLCRIIKSMLNERPDKRPKSALTVKKELQQVSHLDWRKVPGEDLVWTGQKAHKVKSGRDRYFEVKAKLVSRGINAGQFQLSARWRFRNAETWRGMPSISVLTSKDDVGSWRNFFKSVSEQAQRWAAK